jgi:hypothetical protein
MAPLKRENIFQIRISEDERRMLQVIADEDGLTSSDVVRQFIRREWMRRYQQELPNQRKATK